MKWLTPDVVQGVLRHLLTFGGGILVANGHATAEQINSIGAALADPQLIGGVAAVVGIIMSYFHKQDVAGKLADATAPSVTVSTSTSTVAK